MTEIVPDKAPKQGEFFEGKLWFERKGSVLTLGVTSSAIEQVGAIESVEFPGEGDDFDKGDVIVTVEGSRGTLEIITPAAGIVEEINKVARDEPEIVAEDPLEEGWLVKLEIEDPADLREFISH